MPKIGGWKTKTGAVLMGIAPILAMFGIDPEIVSLVQEVGQATMGIGIAHKVMKAQSS